MRRPRVCSGSSSPAIRPTRGRANDAEHVGWHHGFRARDAPRRPPRHALPRAGSAAGGDDGDGDVIPGLPIFLMLVWQYDGGGKAGWRRRRSRSSSLPRRRRLRLASNKVFNPTYAETGVPLLPPLGSGGYKDLLGVNVYGQLACIGFALGFAIDQWVVPNLIPALAPPRVRRTSRTRSCPRRPRRRRRAASRCRPASERAPSTCRSVPLRASLMPPFIDSTAWPDRESRSRFLYYSLKTECNQQLIRHTKLVCGRKVCREGMREERKKVGECGGGCGKRGRGRAAASEQGPSRARRAAAERWAVALGRLRLRAPARRARRRPRDGIPADCATSTGTTTCGCLGGSTKAGRPRRERRGRRRTGRAGRLGAVIVDSPPSGTCRRRGGEALHRTRQNCARAPSSAAGRQTGGRASACASSGAARRCTARRARRPSRRRRRRARRSRARRRRGHRCGAIRLACEPLRAPSQGSLLHLQYAAGARRAPRTVRTAATSGPTTSRGALRSAHPAVAAAAGAAAPNCSTTTRRASARGATRAARAAGRARARHEFRGVGAAPPADADASLQRLGGRLVDIEERRRAVARPAGGAGGERRLRRYVAFVAAPAASRHGATVSTAAASAAPIAASCAQVGLPAGRRQLRAARR